MSAVGLLGGTFDPIHYAHLRLAEELADRLGLAQVRFVPAHIPPHRGAPSVTAAHRVEMVRLAVRGNPRFQLDDRECRRPGPSYTVDTLAELRAELGPDVPLMLLMGEDAYLALETWSRWQQLFDLAHIVVAGRPGFNLEPARLPAALARATNARMAAQAAELFAAGAGRVLPVDTTELAISATRIRQLIGAGHSARYLLPEEVLVYIQTHQLYKEIDAG